MQHMADDAWIVIAITREAILRDEALRVRRLLDAGIVDRVHLRHPAASNADIARLLRDIGTDYWSRLSIHSHAEVVAESAGVGLHLGGSCRRYVGERPAVLSRSMHSLDELAEADDYDYVTLSPIYDSISKTGYKSAFSLDANLSQAIVGHRVVALGGVTPSRFDELKDIGFMGAAMLGWIWDNDKI